MSKSSLFLGLVVSIAAHVVLFFMLSIGAAPQPADRDHAAQDRVTIDPALFAQRDENEAAMPEQVEDEKEVEEEIDDMPELEPEPELLFEASVHAEEEDVAEVVAADANEEVDAEPDSDPEPELAELIDEAETDPTPLFEHVIDPEAIKALAESDSGDYAEQSDSLADRVPMLRISWSGASEVREVARALGMRIVAVTRDQEIVGEVRLTGPPTLETFDADLGTFSNRVRSFPAVFFGTEILDEVTHRIAAYWLLVPVHVDRELVRIQHAAIRERGVKAEDVRRMEATFEQRGNRPTLIITNIFSRS